MLRLRAVSRDSDRAQIYIERLWLCNLGSHISADLQDCALVAGCYQRNGPPLLSVHESETCVDVGQKWDSNSTSAPYLA